MGLLLISVQGGGSPPELMAYHGPAQGKSPVGTATSASEPNGSQPHQASVFREMNLTIDPVGNRLRLRIAGQGIDALSIQLYALAGRSIYTSGFVKSREAEWDLRTRDGRRLPNGVYLYLVTVRASSGTIQPIPIKKIIFVR